MTHCNVAIIGAGPYGLSIAAHLRARGIEHRIFGRPMDTWLTRMPKGMRLKSEGFASSLYDPNLELTLDAYCKREGLPYADIGLPVPLETFTRYGLEFQKRFVPELEDKLVDSLSQSSAGLQLRLMDGEVCCARTVIIAVGLTHYEYMPPLFSDMPEEFVSHSSAHHALDQFQGRSVAVVGAGSSALDLAALLHQAGADVQLVARRSTIRFQGPPLASPIRQLQMNAGVPHLRRRDVNTQMEWHLPNHFLLDEPARRRTEGASHETKPKALWHQVEHTRCLCAENQVPTLCQASVRRAHALP